MKKRLTQSQNDREALNVICAMQIGWDGYNPNSAKQMRGLMLDMVEVAARALRGEPVLISGEELEKKTVAYGNRKKVKHRSI